MQERNVIQGTTATILAPFIDNLNLFIVWFIVAIVLIIGDCRFGTRASRMRGEVVRRSRVIRRSINKMVDYICWVSIAWALGSSFGQIFNIPILGALIMLVVCIVELSSIYDNYFECKGVKKRFNVWKFFSKLFKVQELEESIEDIK